MVNIVIIGNLKSPVINELCDEIVGISITPFSNDINIHCVPATEKRPFPVKLIMVPIDNMDIADKICRRYLKLIKKGMPHGVKITRNDMLQIDNVEDTCDPTNAPNMYIIVPDIGDLITFKSKTYPWYDPYGFFSSPTEDYDAKLYKIAKLVSLQNYLHERHKNLILSTWAPPLFYIAGENNNSPKYQKFMDVWVDCGGATNLLIHEGICKIIAGQHKLLTQ